eukprot:269614_1
MATTTSAPSHGAVIDTRNFNTILTISYVSIQSTIAIIMSIVGAIHVRRWLSSNSVQSSPQITAPNTVRVVNDDTKKDNNTIDSMMDTQSGSTFCTKEFGKLWVKTVWKLRGVYSGLAVHSFDVLTDILVILQWLQQPDRDDDHVDTQIMAYSAIFVMCLSRVISTTAIYLKERDICRCILQFCDLLIFQEIYESHKKVVSQMKKPSGKQKPNKVVESTLSFKYIRSLESVFESIPESILQLVYVMRTREMELIFVLSIIQSIVSMTNSILNNDGTRMQQEKWDKYKQRLPPTIYFAKHAMIRLAEIVYRIGLLSLLWTICGGLAFSIIMIVELIIICGRTAWLIYDHQVPFNADTVLLAMNSIIVVPSEDVYATGYEWHFWIGSGARRFEETFADVSHWYRGLCLWWNFCLCLGLTAFVASFSGILCQSDCDTHVHFVPLVRINTSFLEFIFLIVYVIVFASDERKEDFKELMPVFLATMIFYLIFTQYNVLFPNFRLPYNVNVRSKWGYAFSDELGELQKIKIPDDQRKPSDFWDEPCAHEDDGRPLTAVIFALAHGNHHVVSWLEQQGAKRHKLFDQHLARLALKMDDVDMGEVSQTLIELIVANRVEDVCVLMALGATLTLQALRVYALNPSLLKVMSASKQSSETYIKREWFKVFKMVVLADPESIDRKHRLYPLELQCKKGAEFIHFVVSLTAIDDLASFSTKALPQILKDGNGNINSLNHQNETALHCILLKDEYTDADVHNVRFLLDEDIDVTIQSIHDDKSDDSHHTVYTICELHESKENIDEMKDLLQSTLLPEAKYMQTLILKHRYAQISKLMQIGLSLNPSNEGFWNKMEGRTMFTKLLPNLTSGLVDKSMSIEWLKMLQMIMLNDPDCIDEKHILYPLKCACDEGGKLIHLVIAMTRIEKDKFADPSKASTKLLRGILKKKKSQDTEPLIDTDNNKQTALDILVEQNMHNDGDIANIKCLVEKASHFRDAASMLPLEKAQEILKLHFDNEMKEYDDTVQPINDESNSHGQQNQTVCCC